MKDSGQIVFSTIILKFDPLQLDLFAEHFNNNKNLVDDCRGKFMC